MEYKLSFRATVYYAICLLPLVFMFFMGAGLLEGFCPLGFCVSNIFAIIGLLVFVSLLLIVCFAKLTKIKFERRDEFIVKLFVVLNVQINSRVYETKDLFLEKSNRMLSGTDSFGSHEKIKLICRTPQGVDTILVGDFERTLFRIDLKKLKNLLLRHVDVDGSVREKTHRDSVR